MAYSSSQFVFREELEEVCTEVVEEECTLQEEQVCQQVAEGGGSIFFGLSLMLPFELSATPVL